MRKISFVLFIAIIAMALISCGKSDSSDSDESLDGNNGSGMGEGAFNGRDDDVNSGIENMNNNGSVESFSMIATVIAIDEWLEVDVISALYGNTGRFWVRVSENTSFFDQSGESISLSEIKVGDTVEITYSGQVMMSYPPQIIALSIIVK